MRGDANLDHVVNRVPFNAFDGEARFDVYANPLPVAGNVRYGVAAHIVSSGSYLQAGVHFKPDGTVDAYTGNRDAGTETVTTVGSVLTGYVANTDVSVRVQFQANPDVGGTDVRVRVWKATDPEPEAWTTETNQTAFASAGGWGMKYFLYSGTTNQPLVGARFVTFSAIDASGQIILTDEAGVGPLATVAAALAQIGDWNDGNVRIVMTGDVEESIVVNGLGGGGTLILDGGDVTTVYGYIRFYGVNHEVSFATS